MRLVIVSIFSAIAVILVLFATHLYGLSKTKLLISHDFLSDFKGAPKLIAYRGFSAKHPENTILALKAAYKKDPQVIFFIDLQQTQDGHLILMADNTLDRTTNGKGTVKSHTLEEINKLRTKGEKIPTLEQAFKLFPDSRFILNIQANEKGIHRRVVSEIEKHQAGSKVLIHSDYDVIISAIKKIKSRWLFGSGQAEITKLKLLEGLFIQTIAPLKGDIVVAPLFHQQSSRRSFSTTLIKEIHRRKMKVILGPIHTKEDLKTLTKENVDGILTSFL